MDSQIDLLEQLRREALDEARRHGEAQTLQLAKADRYTFLIDSLRQVRSGGSILDVPFAASLLHVDSQSESALKDVRSLEQIILELFNEAEEGLTSVDVVEFVAQHSDAKKESVTSTLSRMVNKKTLKRDGRLYYKADELQETEPSTQPSQDGVSSETGGEKNLFEGLDR